MRTITVRQVEDHTADVIAQTAKKKGLSMEAAIRSILKQTAYEWENEQEPETGRELLERVRRRFTEIDGKGKFIETMSDFPRQKVGEPMSFPE